MNRSLLGSLLLVASLASSEASAADVGLALQGGTHTSWASVTGPAAFATESETRFAGGVAVPIRVSERFSFEPGLLHAETAFSSPGNLLGLRDLDESETTVKVRSFRVLVGFAF